MAIYVLDKNLAAAWPVLAFTPPQQTLDYNRRHGKIEQDNLDSAGWDQGRWKEKIQLRREELIHWPINLPILGANLVTLLKPLGYEFSTGRLISREKTAEISY